MQQGRGRGRDRDQGGGKVCTGHIRNSKSANNSAHRSALERGRVVARERGSCVVGIGSVCDSPFDVTEHKNL